MSKWIDFKDDERRAMIQKVSEKYDIDEAAAEKDWWVTAVLNALFNMSCSEYLLFKGGTSLSKGWGIINRFSEDIDLALDRLFFLNVKKEKCADCTSNTQIHHLREKGQDYVFGEFKEELQQKLNQMGLKEVVVKDENEMIAENGTSVDHDKDPSVLFVQYPSLYDTSTSPYATPIVKVEISVLSMSEPFEMKTISSLIYQYYNQEGKKVDNDIVKQVKMVSPARTFLEKAFLLCEEYQKESPRTLRMSRHLYDLEKLSNTTYANLALKDIELYRSIVEHRRKFYHVGYIDYNKELPASIAIVPPEELLDSFKTDYKNMQESFIYGDSLPFNDLITSLSKLQEKFRKIDMEKL